MEEDRLPKGFICTKCGKPHEFGYYVAAHWYEMLVHTCECGRKHSCRGGRVTRVNGRLPVRMIDADGVVETMEER